MIDVREPLSPGDLKALEDYLDRSTSDEAMNIEELDGFFTALIVGPDTVMPSEYLPVVFGGEMSEVCEFQDIDDVRRAMGLLMRRWNAIVAALDSGDSSFPIFYEDDQGRPFGNDWACGFMRGVSLRRSSWAEFFESEESMTPLLPMLVLAHEDDPDPALRPEPLTDDRREMAIGLMIASAIQLYGHFRQARVEAGRAAAGTSQRRARKVGRNDLCFCGSGKKYKKCCGGATVH
jgi:uncharacterized protein